MKKSPILILTVLLMCSTILFNTSCTKDDDLEPLVATSIELVLGENQTAQVETALANPIEILVKDQNGNAFKGTSVTFSVAEGSVSPATATTDANGKVTTSWTLGATVGTQSLTVTAFLADGTTVLSGAPLTISATATAEPLVATSIELVSGDNQTAEVEVVLTNSIKIIVKDQNGDALTGATVNFTPTQGTVTVSQTTTDANGNINTTWTLGSVIGTQTLVITAFQTDGTTPLTNSPLTVDATASAPTTVTDIEGNVYPVVVIGNQIWMAENLKVTKYPNNTEIPMLTDDNSSGNTNDEWNDLLDNNTDAAFCWYDDDIANKNIYGGLYNYAAYMGGNALSSTSNPSGVQGICPTGWHIPSSSEWTELTDYLENNGYGYGGSGDDIGKSMAGTSGWETAITTGNVGNDQASNNTSGLAIVPSGYRIWSGTFIDKTRYADLASATEFSPNEVWLYNLNYGKATVTVSETMKTHGSSVRCVRD